MPDANFEVTVAKCDLGKEQQREKREQGREKREEITKKAVRDPQMRLFEHQQLIDNRVCWPLGRRDG